MKIPPHAKKVFSGVIFDTYQWQQEMFDGSMATFEMLKRPHTLQVIPTFEGKIVIAIEEQPNRPLQPTLISGRQEPGEEPLAGIKRELLEEAGFESGDWELYSRESFTGKIEWDAITFIARDCKKVAEQQLEPGEKISLRFVTFDEFIDIVLSDDFWGKNFAYQVMKLKLGGELDGLKQKLLG